MDQKDNRDACNIFYSNEQVLDTYPELFQPVPLEDDLCHMEKDIEINRSPFRFFLLPTELVVAVASQETPRIWELPTDGKLQEFLEKLIQDTKDYTDTKDIKRLVRTMIFNSEIYTLRILPYGDKRSSELTKHYLDERKMGYILDNITNNGVS